MSEPENTDPVAAVRAELLRDLPGDIKRVRNAYRRAAQQAALLRDAKDFNTHQAACKAALGHLDGLIKLLRWAAQGVGDVDDAASDKTNVDQLIAEAKRSLDGV
ncbi:hypothetical protein [Thalassospira sp. ER-Se-21-Dark]|uniref:hypothetical protein n=1 Tax=Thalassospira sp. ER-Se-21-Dark TaxID=2585190 RepID=UPI001B3175BE|nr:hypothetical protein [Thalassospira sp. ER-Se-21-Dark]MBP3127772.1 hypothetical protein [Thalassospira sp. ER-Se-21-Dark]